MSLYSVNNFNCCTNNFEEAQCIIGWHYIFQNFLVLGISYCLKTYCYIFDLYLFVLGRERFFTFVSKKPYYLIFRTNYLKNTSPYLTALANLGCR